MNTSIKITAKHMKEIKRLAPAVAADVQAYRSRYRTRHGNFQTVPAGWTYTLGEGERIKFYAPNGKVLSANMVSERTLGAMNDGVNYRIGQSTPPMPEGTWLVVFELFLGKPLIYVYYVGQLALPA